MNNLFFVFLSFLFLFAAILYLYFKTKRIKLERSDYAHWLKIQNKFRFFKLNFLKNFFLPTKKFFQLILFNFLEKLLRRIKIEALKLENWASKKIEKIKEKNKEQETKNLT